jgi:hypothetical protein
MQQDELVAALDALTQGGHDMQGGVDRRFLECPEWQKCADLIARALNQALDMRQAGPRLSPPPGWLPPLD